MFNAINHCLITAVQSVQVRRLQAEEDGQTLVEYGLILGLLAIAAVAAMTLLGGGITSVFTDVVTQLTGPAAE